MRGGFVNYPLDDFERHIAASRQPRIARVLHGAHRASEVTPVGDEEPDTARKRRRLDTASTIEGQVQRTAPEAYRRAGRIESREHRQFAKPADAAILDAIA